MCNGNAFLKEIERWLPFAESARHESGPFFDAPTRSGVYVLRVARVGTPDLKRVQQTFAESTFMKASERLDNASAALFSQLRFGEDRGWKLAEYYRSRLERVGRIDMKRGVPSCPLVYIGKANNLQRRLRELAFEGHTANAPFWALLMSGWEFEVGIRKSRKKAETAEEARLKQLYRDLHGGNLPPLVQR